MTATVGAPPAPDLGPTVDLPRHLLAIGDLDRDAVVEVLRVADTFVEVGQRANPKVPALRGRTVASLFLEDSTRTRTSFETAARRLSADVMNFAAGSSSLNKGESLRDTIETLEAIGVDAVVVRHASAGTPHQVARWAQRAVVINGGDGWHEHPTQALLDLYSVREALGGGDRGLGRLEGLRMAVVGDVRHSRVARSQIAAFAALGAEITLVAPATLLPPSLEGWPVAGVGHDLDAVLPEMDVVSLLRVQAERGSGAYVPSLREYTAGYGLTLRRSHLLGDGALIIHPGPIVRGVEIAGDVAELPNALITDQVRNGVAVRMAVLYLLLARGPGAATAPGDRTGPGGGDRG